MGSRKKWTLYYDGQCSMCSTSARLAGGPILGEGTEARPYQDLSEPPHGLTHDDLLRSVWLVSESGKTYEGFHAIRRLALHKPLLWPLTPFLWLPGMGRLGPKLYRWVTRHRPRRTSL